MTDKQRAAKVLELLAERYPDLETHLMAESPWELLVATVLAAQCTDKRVNQVTPELFRRWPDPAALAQATIPELEEVIHSVGFYHSKAKHLIAAAQLVVKEFNGETPNTMKDLIKLFPQSEWGKVNHRMVWFGRHVCDARKPLCDECEMASFCPKVGVE